MSGAWTAAAGVAVSAYSAYKGSGASAGGPSKGQLKRSRQITDKQRKLSTAQLDWAKEQNDYNKALYEDIKATQMPAIQQQMKIAGDLGIASGEDRTRYMAAFKPFEDSLMAEAADYATRARKEKEMGAAESQVGQAFDAAAKNAKQNLEGYGINPGDLRYGALNQEAEIAKATAAAQAGNTAALEVDATGRALRNDVIGLGQNTVGRANEEAKLASTVGATGVLGANTVLGGGLDTTTSAINTQKLGTDTLAAAGSTNNMTPVANATPGNGMGQLGGALAGAGLNAYIGKQTPELTDTVRVSRGGVIHRDDGGSVPDQVTAIPPRNHPTDTVAAQLSPDEFIVNANAAKWIGHKKLYDMQAKAEEESNMATAKTDAESQGDIQPISMPQPAIQPRGGIA